MEYDPIKNKFGVFFNQSIFLRKSFYKLLDLLLLRTWHVHKILKEWMTMHKNGADILDAGSGFGQYSFYVANQNKNYKILAVDVKDDQVRDCNQFFAKCGLTNVEFKVDDLVTYRKENAYDLIISVDVMEHILEDVEVFKNFYASLRDGGMLIINTPSDQGGSDVHGEGEESFIGEHVRDGYNINDIQDKLKLAGFTKIDARYAYGKPGQISWRLSMKYPMLMLNASFLFVIILPFYYLITYPIAYTLNYFDVNGNHTSGTGLSVRAWK
ncbi:MAG: class I SAM-dependent methyltransferase [Bacteroidetes bacterium]|nr:class I SAM-dependent methyltransferase [Bacteroidota bacterium]